MGLPGNLRGESALMFDNTPPPIHHQHISREGGGSGRFSNFTQKRWPFCFFFQLKVAKISQLFYFYKILKVSLLGQIQGLCGKWRFLPKAQRHSCCVAVCVQFYIPRIAELSPKSLVLRASLRPFSLGLRSECIILKTRCFSCHGAAATVSPSSPSQGSTRHFPPVEVKGKLYIAQETFGTANKQMLETTGL